MDVSRELSDINGVNGRIQDYIDSYSLLRDLFEQAWYRSNRAYGLRPVLEHYDYTIGVWEAPQRQAAERPASVVGYAYASPAADLGLPLPDALIRMRAFSTY